MHSTLKKCTIRQIMSKRYLRYVKTTVLENSHLQKSFIKINCKDITWFTYLIDICEYPKIMLKSVRKL